MDKKRVKRERLKLLQRQSELEINHCENCNVTKQNGKRDCSGCAIYTELNSIGEELLSLTNASRCDEDQERENKILNVEKFVELRGQGLTQLKIAELAGVLPMQVSRWKKANEKEIQSCAAKKGIDLKKVKISVRRPVTLSVDKFAELRKQGLSQSQIAEQFNITESAVSHWKMVNQYAIEQFEKEHGIDIESLKRPRRTKSSRLTVAEFAKLRKEGLTIKQIADRFKVGVSTVYTWKKKHKSEIKELLEVKKVEESTRVSKVKLSTEDIVKQVRQETGVSEEEIVSRIAEVKPDNINPAHYQQGGIETFDYIQAKLTSHELDGYLKGNIIKYVSRERLKNSTEDLKKAQWYLDKLVEIRGK